MTTYYTSHAIIDMDDFIKLMETEYGFAVNQDDETELDDEIVFAAGGSSFAAWEEGDRIGARSIPREVDDLFAAEGTPEYQEYNGIEDDH